MALVRAAIPQDLPILLAMTQTFAQMCPWIVKIGVDPEALLPFLAGMIDAPLATILVAEAEGEKIVGMLGAVCHEAFFHRGCRIAQELAWYVESTARAQTIGYALLQAFETWATAMEAQVWILATVPTSGAHVDAFLQLHGYMPGETAYIRVSGGN